MKVISALLAVCLSVVPITAPADAQSGNPVFTISSSEMEVEMYRDFPSVKSYRFTGSGLEFDAAVDGPGELVVNGKVVEAVIGANHNRTYAGYDLEIPAMDAVLRAEFSVEGNVLHMLLGVVRDTEEDRIHSVAFSGAPLLSCNSRADAQFAGARMYTAIEGTGDTFTALDGSEPADDERQGYMYAMLSNGQLCGSIWTEAVYDFPEGPTARENGRIWKQTVMNWDSLRTGIWSGDWLMRAEGSSELEPLVQMKVVLTADANADNLVDWQDGAIAYRSVMHIPLGAERIKEQVVQRLVHNFGSQATNPFLKVLDETKRVYNATGGLGQHVILKGYQNEGHDSAHPDYGGNYNERAGGLKDLKLLVEKGQLYNADFGVHINAQEAYPEAKNFTEELTLEQKGWSWLDQAWVIDKRSDALTGNRDRRLQQLANELPGLQFIYLDVWYQDGWESRRVAREINSRGWSLTTEFPDRLEWDSTWYHWAVDKQYGGETLKGINSDIVRFIHNHLRDTWIADHPLLGGAELMGYEGWQGRRDFNRFIDTTFSVNLPTKWLQHFEITNWNDDEIRFTGNVVARMEDGRRVITKDGRVVLDGDSYLLPWPPHEPEHYIHYSNSGEPAYWSYLSDLRLDERFGVEQGQELPLYISPLTEFPASDAEEMELVDGREFISRKGIHLVSNIFTAVDSWYTPESISYGESSGFLSPGFNDAESGMLNADSHLNPSQVARNEFGDNELHVEGGAGFTLVKTIFVDEPGTYALSLDVELRGDTPRRVSMHVEGGSVPTGFPSTAWLDIPSSVNYVAADPKHGRAMQRMQLIVDIASVNPRPELYVKVAEGEAHVLIDNLQCVPAVRPPLPDGAYFFEDFEHIVRGWYPFVKGDAGGANDMRTHLSQRHEPYTQRGWRGRLIDDVLDGEWSLKSHADKPGLLYRTIPQNLRFDPGYRYIVTLDYASSGDQSHEIVISDSSGKEVVIPLKQALVAQPILFRFRAADDGSSWIGVRKPEAGDTDLVIDNLLVMQEEIEE